MAMYVGSFAQGLFGGAQSAFQLYSMYEGIRSEQEWRQGIDDAKQLKADERAADTANKESPGWNKSTHSPGIRTMTPTQGTPDQPAAPAATPEGPGVDTKRVMATGFGPAIGGRKALDSTPGAGAQAYPPQPNESGPMYPFEPQMPNPSADYRTAIPTPQPPPPVAISAYPPPPAAPELTPGQRAGTEPLPMFRPAVTGLQTPVARGVLDQPNVPPRSQVSPTQMNTYDVPPEGYSPQPPRPPRVNTPAYNQMLLNSQMPPVEPPPPVDPTQLGAPGPMGQTQPVGGYLGSVGQQTPPMPTRQPGGPVAPPQTDPLRYTPPNVPQMQPGGGSVGVGGTPQAQAEPPSFASRLLSAVNPIGSAQAAPVPPQGATVAPPAERQPLAPPAERQPLAGAPAAPAVPAALAAKPGAAAPAAPPSSVPYQPYEGVTEPATPVQPTGIAPAEPPKAGPAPQSPPPVAVPGKAGQVAPGQSGPSQQSETTPTVIAPIVSPVYWDYFAKNDPKLAALIEQVIAEQGSGISKYDVAAIIYRESRGRPGAEAHGAMGAGRGLMQIEPATQRLIDPQMKFDPFNPKDNITLGVKLLQDLGGRMGLGLGSVQMHVAYMRGFGEDIGLKRLQKVGWEQYSKEQKIAADGVNMLFNDKVKIHDGMFPGGKQMDAGQIVQAAESGPQGLMNYMANSGPPATSMSDRWRQVQSTLEFAAMRMGKMDALGPIQDWVAQQAHQGTVSNLLSAYQSMASGNPVAAASALAAGHAFFPDDSYARFGVDQKGQIWGTQFSETTGEALGKPFKITQEMIAQQALALQHPHNFFEVLQKYQAGNADIDLKKAHAKYYTEMPEISRANAAERAAAQVEAAGIRSEGAAQRQADNQRYRADMAAAHDANLKGINDTVEKYYPAVEETPSGLSSDVRAAESEMFRSLIMPHSMGGAGLGPLQAKGYAEGLRKRELTLARGEGPGGKLADFIIKGKDPNNRLTAVTPEQGDKMRVIMGIPPLAGAQPIAPPAAPAQRAASPVGAGLGSQTALNSGYNTFTGVQARPMQQAAR